MSQKRTHAELHLRLDRELVQRIRERAKGEGKEISHIVSELIQKGMATEETERTRKISSSDAWKALEHGK